MNTATPKIVAICGSGDGCGKTTVGRFVASLLHSRGIRTVTMPLAEPMKGMASALYRFMNPDGRELPDELKRSTVGVPEFGGYTYREILRTLGTDWGRGCFGVFFWVHLLLMRVARLPDDTVIIIDDMRFFSELTALKRSDALLSIYVFRKTAQDRGEEEDITMADVMEMIPNNGTLEDLEAKTKITVEAYWEE